LSPPPNARALPAHQNEAEGLQMHRGGAFAWFAGGGLLPPRRLAAAPRGIFDQKKGERVISGLTGCRGRFDPLATRVPPLGIFWNEEWEVFLWMLWAGPRVIRRLLRYCLLRFVRDGGRVGVADEALIAGKA